MRVGVPIRIGVLTTILKGLILDITASCPVALCAAFSSTRFTRKSLTPSMTSLSPTDHESQLHVCGSDTATYTPRERCFALGPCAGCVSQIHKAASLNTNVPKLAATGGSHAEALSLGTAAPAPG